MILSSWWQISTCLWSQPCYCLHREGETKRMLSWLTVLIPAIWHATIWGTSTVRRHGRWHKQNLFFRLPGIAGKICVALFPLVLPVFFFFLVFALSRQPWLYSPPSHGVHTMNPLKKRQKLDDEQLETYCKELDDMQEKLDDLDKEERDKVIQLSVEYNKLKKPHFAKRNELAAKIPDFWLTAVCPSILPLLSHCKQKMFNLMFCSLNIIPFWALCWRRKMKISSSIWHQWK